MTTGSTPDARSARRWQAAAALLAAALALLASRLVFQGAPVTADETSYRFQANCFLDGVIRRPLPPIAPAFQHDMIILREGIGWLSRYSPGHALWLMPGEWLAAPHLMSAVAAALSAWFLVGCARRLSVHPGLVAGLLLASPWFLFMHGTLLCHTSAHLAFVVGLWAYLAWLDTRRWRYTALSGCMGGFMVLSRSFTALLMGAPLALHALAYGLRRRTRAVWIGVGAAALGVAGGLAATLLYNRLATGSAGLSPFLAYDDSDGLGFGWRHVHGGCPCFHTWAAGWHALLARLRLLDRWLVGIPGSLPAVALLALAGWSWPAGALLAAPALALWAGYVFFFANTADAIGPLYYFESLPCLLLLAAIGLQRLWTRWGGTRPARRVAVAAVLAALALDLSFAGRAGLDLRRALARDAGRRRFLRAAPSQALVILKDITADYGSLTCNLRGLDSRPLIAGYFDEPVALAVAKCFPARAPYLMTEQDGQLRLIPFDRNRPLEVFLDGPRLHAYTGALEPLPDGQSVRVCREGRDRAHWMACRGFAWLSPGRYTVHYTLALSNVAPDRPVTVDAIPDSGARVLAERTLSGSMPVSDVPLAITLAGSAYVETRVHYGGSGAAAVLSIRVREDAGACATARPRSAGIRPARE